MFEIFVLCEIKLNEVEPYLYVNLQITNLKFYYKSLKGGKKRKTGGRGNPGGQKLPKHYEVKSACGSIQEHFRNNS